MKASLRQLARRPGFTLPTVLTIALGIGATTAVFSVVNGILMRPLPYANADRLVMLFEGLPRSDLPRMMVSAADFTDFRAQQRSFEGLAAYQNHEFELSAGGAPERVVGSRVSAGVFPLLGVRPMMVAAAVGGRLLAGQLVGVAPRDPTTLLSLGLVAGGVALLASYLPARRATKVDAMVAIREE